MFVQNAGIPLAPGTRAALQRERPLESAAGMANLGGGSHPGCAVLTGHAFRGSSIPFASLKRRRPIDTVLPAERASNGRGLTALSHAIGKVPGVGDDGAQVGVLRSEEHTSELQSL